MKTPASGNRSARVWVGAVLAGALAAAAFAQDAAVRERLQYLEDVFRLNQIALHRELTGQNPSPEDFAWMQKFNARRAGLNAEFRRTHPPKDSIGVKPLNDLGTGEYKGEQGGLYPEGKNTMPEAHLKAGLALARSIRPLNAAGQPDANGKIVFASIGYSNWTHEFSMFVEHAVVDRQRDPRVFVIDCAVNAQSTEVSSHPDAEYYRIVDKRLAYAGYTPRQVQVVMFKVATQAPTLPFPQEPKILQEHIVKTMHVLQERFPNLKIAYLTSRIYGGYALTALNPEPHAFETGFAVKWAIADQIKGNPELNYDPKHGAVRAPWMAWGPYLWADGTTPRSDGLTWQQIELREDDRTHPSYRSRGKVGQMIDRFLKSDPTAKAWYARKQ